MTTTTQDRSVELNWRDEYADTAAVVRLRARK
jgi:hypothetical protein